MKLSKISYDLVRMKEQYEFSEKLESEMKWNNRHEINFAILYEWDDIR